MTPVQLAQQGALIVAGFAAFVVYGHAQIWVHEYLHAITLRLFGCSPVVTLHRDGRWGRIIQGGHVSSRPWIAHRGLHPVQNAAVALAPLLITVATLPAYAWVMLYVPAVWPLETGVTLLWILTTGPSLPDWSTAIGGFLGRGYDFGGLEGAIGNHAIVEGAIA